MCSSQIIKILPNKKKENQEKTKKNFVEENSNNKPKMKIEIKKPSKPSVIIDGPGVACKYKKNVSFSSSGLEISIKFFEKRGHKVVAFVPEFYLRRKPSDKMVF